MFGHKRNTDSKPTLDKFLDTKKEPVRRLRYLFSHIDRLPKKATKALFDTYYCIAYQVFHDAFTALEPSIRSRGGRIRPQGDTHNQELFDVIMPSLELILTYLPNLINRRWQANSIGVVLAKLLHPGSAPKVRSVGTNLLVLWVQGLRENVTQFAEQLFASVIPGIVPAVASCVFPSAEGSDHGWVSGPEIGLTAAEVGTSWENSSGEATIEILEAFLDILTTQCNALVWEEDGLQQNGFNFLFHLLKKHYLFAVFKEARLHYGPYDGGYKLLACQSPSFLKSSLPLTLCIYDAFGRWFLHWLSEPVEVLCIPHTTSVTGSKSITQVADKVVRSSSGELPDVTTAKASLTQIGSQGTTPTRQVLTVLYSSKENVTLIHEVIRCVYFLPASYSKTIIRLTDLITTWADNVSSRPLFMREENESPTGAVKNPLEPKSSRPRSSSDALLQIKPGKMTHVATSAVRCGFVSNLNVFITSASHVFFSKVVQAQRDEHRPVCNNVIGFYQKLVQHPALTSEIWIHLHHTLLKAAASVLQVFGTSALPLQVTESLLSTLFIVMLKASLVVEMPISMWDNTLEVLSGCSNHPSVVKQWTTVTCDLTKVLSRQVYNLVLPSDEVSHSSDQRGKARVQKQRRQDGGPSEERRFTMRSHIPGVALGSRSSVPIANPEPVASGVQQSNSIAATRSAACDPQSPSHASRSTMSTPRSTRPSQSGSLESGDSWCVEPTCTESADEIEEKIEKTKSLSSKLHLSREKALHGIISFAGKPASADSSLFSTANGDHTPSSRRRSSLSLDISSVLSIPNRTSPGARHHSNSAAGDKMGRPPVSPQGSIMEESSQDESTDSSACGKVPHGNLDSEPGAASDSSSIDKTTSSSPQHLQNLQKHPDRPLSRGVDGVAAPTPPDGDYKSLAATNDLDHERVLGVLLSGWSPDLAAVLWRRVVGLLGNPNRFKSAVLHEAAFKCLTRVWEDLLKVYNRIGEAASVDSESHFDPPLQVFAPWALQAFSLPDDYQAGKLRAAELLCRMMLIRHDHPLTSENLVHFYHRLNVTLMSANEGLIDCVVMHTRHLFSFSLPGAYCLIVALLSASKRILRVSDSINGQLDKKSPAGEDAPFGRPDVALLGTLGSLLQIGYLYRNLPIHHLDGSGDVSLMQCKDQIVKLLLKVASFQTGPVSLKARCLSISMIGMYIYSELLHNQRHHSRWTGGVYTLLCAIGKENPSVALSAVDILFLLTENIHTIPKDKSKIIVESLCSCMAYIVTDDFCSRAGPIDSRGNLLIRILQCIVQWTMGLASQSRSGSDAPVLDSTLLMKVFTILHKACGKLTPQDLLTNNKTSSKSDSNTGMDTPTTPSHEPTIDCLSVNLAARAALDHLISFLDHFPFGAGAARLCSTVIECDDHVRHKCSADLVDSVFSAPNVLFFSFDDSTIISVSEIEKERTDDSNRNACTNNVTTRIIVRNMTGKWTWDAGSLYGEVADDYPGLCASLAEKNWCSSPLDSGAECEPLDSSSPKLEQLNFASVSQGNHYFKSHPLHTPLEPHMANLPSHKAFTAMDGDHFNELLEYLSASSAECLSSPDVCFSNPADCTPLFPSSKEEMLLDTIGGQHQKEQRYTRQFSSSMAAPACKPACFRPPVSVYHHSRCLLLHLGFFNPDKIKTFRLLNKNDKLRRELKHLDSRPYRETHKIAVVYVAPGQNDKQTILSNTKGSAAFEAFVSALSWEVDLSTHPGFMGGLQRNATTGATAPYFSTSSMEAIFHVSTRMPTVEGTGIINKLRHIGNDEVQIIWSEHDRDWRRDIIRTEFGDVMIVLYPLKNALCRVQILTKPDSKLPHFGPLFDGAVVDMVSLPGLVRATAINANRAKRSELPFYQAYYEERARYISNLSRNCEKAVSLEEFFVEVVQPGQPDAYTPAHCDVPAAWKAEKSSNQHGSVLMVPVQVIQPASRMVPKSPSEATYDVGSVAPMTEMGEDVFT